MNGPMKTFMDRMLIPWGDRYVTLQDGRSHHPMKKKKREGKVFPSFELRLLGDRKFQLTLGTYERILLSCGT